MPFRTVFAALFAGALLVPALADKAGPIDTPPMAIGTEKPVLDLALLADGTKPNWDQLKGKIVVVDFWATWCTPCIADFPKVNALQAQYKDVVFLSVTYETAESISETLAQWPLTTQVALDNDFHTYEAFNAWGIPVAYVFDRDGKLITSLHPDHLDAAVIDAAIAGRKPDVEQAKAWSDPKGAETYFRSLRDKASK